MKKSAIVGSMISVKKERLLCALSVGLLLSVFPTNTFADGNSRPFWTQKSSYVEGKILYAVGIASHVKTVEAGRQQAWLNGKKEISNFAQIMDLSGVDIGTQMTFQARNSDGTFKVYRLLKVSIPNLTKWKTHLLDQASKALAEQNSLINKKIVKRKALLRILDQSTQALADRSQEVNEKIAMRNSELRVLNKQTHQLKAQIHEMKVRIAKKQKQVSTLGGQYRTMQSLEERASTIQRKLALYSYRVQRYIKCGMTKSQVQDLLGRPQAEIDFYKNINIITVSYGYFWIRFHSGVVTSIQKDTSMDHICP